jgi:ATP-binding cassette, subfamily B, bacterial
VLDEPSAGLDASSTRRLLEPLRRLMRDRATLLITHDLELAAAADEVVVLEAGRIVQRGAPDRLAGGAWARLRGEEALAA